MAHEIETPRLCLRPCSPADVPVLHDLWTSESVRRFLFDGRVISPDESRSFVEASVGNFTRRGCGLWLAFERERGEVIGFAGFLFAEGEEAPGLIYGISSEHCEQGYATECGRAVLNYALGPPGAARVTADVDEPNAASVRVLEKLGLGLIGRAVVGGRPLLYYELLRRAAAV